MINLNNRIALVTGGSRGIGASAAIHLARAGADVAILYHKHLPSARLVLKFITASGRRGIILRVNVENFTECKKAVDRVLREFSRIDILVNSAGIWKKSSLTEMTPEEWDTMIAINLRGTFNMCKAVVPIMKRKHYGKIVNISSTAGQRGEAFYSHYAASKGGIQAFTKSIATELIHDGIWVNCVAPGWVATDMTATTMRKQSERTEIMRSIPRGKVATPDEIAGPVLFLASSLSDHIVGEILNVNGGSVLCG